MPDFSWFWFGDGLMEECLSLIDEFRVTAIEF
jgi:hypothetical protein